MCAVISEVFESDPRRIGYSGLSEPIRYSEKSEECVLYLLTPWDKEVPHPLVVFVQGSAWQRPNPLHQLPQLSSLSRRGYAVAAVVHRNCLNGHPFPAYLRDVKCAIRFLRANAEKYRIDPERVAVWGTSSGGNTALLTAVTGDDPAYKTDEYAEYSDSVKLCVSCFGPADMMNMPGAREPQAELNPIVKALSGDADPYGVMDRMSPALLVDPSKTYPPTLLLHGDADPVVPFDQSERMFGALSKAGADVKLIRVSGAVHEGNFWSEKLLERIFTYITERI